MSSWGRLRRVPHHVSRPAFLDEAQGAVHPGEAPLACYGLGRSYGDVCLNENGRLLVTDLLDRIVLFDRERGLLRAEAGLSLDRLLRVIVPAGWFVPAMPGTKFVTLGGAVANDVHGKNHEHAGTFGAHVATIGLARSSGEVLTLSRSQNAELFAATVGGLGLTGVILWVELELDPIHSAQFDTETFPLAGLADFFRRAEESRDWPYTAAWIDCLAKGSDTGRGFFTRGRHAESGGLAVHAAPRLSAPIEAPGFLLNGYSMSLFNTLMRHRQPRRDHELLLRVLGLHVPVVRRGLDHRGGQVHDVRRFRPHRRDHALGGGHVVGNECLLLQSADLRVREHDDVGIRHRGLPVIVAGKIGLDHGDVRVQAAQDRGVGLVLVERDDVGIAARLQARDQVLPDQAGGAGDRDLDRRAHQIFSRRNTNQGRWRMIIMISHQNHGV